MEGNYLELSQFPYNSHQSLYNSHPIPLGTTRFLTFMGLADRGVVVVGYGYGCFDRSMGSSRSMSWARCCCESDWKVLGLGGGCVIDDGGGKWCNSGVFYDSGGKLCLKMTLEIQLIKISLGTEFWRYFIII